MSSQRPQLSHFGFVKTYVVPAALIFLVPVLSFFFFRHARDQFDAGARTNILADIAADKTLTAEQKEEATQFFTQVPLSRLIQDPEFKGNIDASTRFNYQTFAWMIFLSWMSIACGAGVFLLGGVCVALSLKSQAAQYWSLMIGWQVLRIYAALQTVVMGVLLIALSYWVTALWFNVFIVKLILIAAIFAFVGVCAVIRTIFANPKQQHEVPGKLLDPTTSQAFRDRLQAICSQIGADPPDQIIAGIDDSFFVTEQPITVEDKTYRGKTLFVSLALLKQLNSAEADAVLAHEMAHFSGQDTLYSNKISPLLARFDAYLVGLYEGAISLPVFYYMNCFRALFEVSLSRIRRQRELRADSIAASVTSPRDFATALLRITAYSKFRQQVENDLFSNEIALESANVSQRVEAGFPTFAAAFASKSDLAELETAHPFDSHPPTAQRMAALGVVLNPAEMQTLLTAGSNSGRWHEITDAAMLEAQQWQAYEEQFRKAHEDSLPYRFLPETEEQREVVKQAFPDLSFSGKDGELVIDCETIHAAKWSDTLRWSEINRMDLAEGNVLTLYLNRDGERSRTIRIARHATAEQAAILLVIQRYYGRYLMAVAYQEQKTEAPSE